MTKQHRYIDYIDNQGGIYIIYGNIGKRRYMYYTKAEAMKRYNAEARSKSSTKRKR